jgi:hypothetical protein
MFDLFVGLWALKELEETNRRLAELEYNQNYEINKQIYQDYIKRKKEKKEN